MSDDEKLEEAWEAYERIKGALDGLAQILTLSFDENDVFYQCGLDNLEKLKETILDILSHDYNNKEIKYKLRELEFNMKKCLFFQDDQKESKSQSNK